MYSLSVRALLPAGLAAGLLCGCASSGSKPRPAAQPAEPGTAVSSEQIQRTAPNQSVEEILRGRVAGVTVAQSGDGLSVRIRGGSSVYGNNDPLYILDGMPIQPGPNGTVSGLSAYDVESIRVLKDAADTAMYGIRGANGVIIIKTKKAQTQKPN